MEPSHHPKLTSSELSVLWGSYQNDTLGFCTLSYFLKVVEDLEIRAVLEYGLELAKEHINWVTKLFKKEQVPIPAGFTEQDVNLQASRLFSDLFMLSYILNMGSMGLNTYSVALPQSSRKDVRDYYTACLHSSAELLNRSVDLSERMGVYIRPPYIPYPKEAEFVQKQHFLAGWIGDQRSLTSVEISFLFNNLQRNVLGVSLLQGFSQVAESKQVRHYMERGTEMAKHHCDVFSKFLSEDHLPAPMSWDSMITPSTEAPFSDKLMMFNAAALNGAGIRNYGASLAGSPRRDLGAAYSRLIMEVGEFSTDGANIMIDKEWLEKPPSAL